MDIVDPLLFPGEPLQNLADTGTRRQIADRAHYGQEIRSHLLSLTKTVPDSYLGPV